MIEDADDSTRIISVYYCVKWEYWTSKWEHFRGFRATLSSDTGLKYQEFGSMDPANDLCEEITIDEEIMYFTVYEDSNDIEGFVFTGHAGSEYSFRANGEDASPTYRMPGRPIGFGIYTGDGGTSNQPLQISIFYNECNCPASTFMENSAPTDMSTVAITGPDDVQTLGYQENYMEFTYSQNCGTYSIEFSPDYSFLQLAQTGSTSGPNNLAYWDQLTL